MTRASQQLKKGRVKLGQILELPPDTSVFELPSELVGRGAQTAGFGGALPKEDSIATPPSMLQKLKC